MINVATDRDVCHVSLYGELDLAGIETLDEELRAALASTVTEVILDLSGLDFMDCSGLRLVLRTSFRSRRRPGPAFGVLRGPDRVHRVFELTGVANEVPFLD
jgi:anti-anti-sigma factor